MTKIQTFMDTSSEKEIYVGQEFGGERPLFARHGLVIEGCTIHAGESAIKECSDVTAIDCRFEGKYPFWHVDGFRIDRCLFKPGARAALWYSRGLEMTDTVVEAPKMFREMDGMTLRHVRLTDAQETMWHCSNVKLEDVELVNGDYLMMHGRNIDVRDYKHQGNYSYQYCENVTIRDAVIDSKDAFWNTKDVTVYDSELHGEYLAWHSENLRLVRCKISGTQPLCYCKNLVMEDCELAEDADLAFEESTLDATIRGRVTSIKNPTSGHIVCDGVGELIIDENIKQPADCRIDVRG